MRTTVALLFALAACSKEKAPESCRDGEVWEWVETGRWRCVEATGPHCTPPEYQYEVDGKLVCAAVLRQLCVEGVGYVDGPMLPQGLFARDACKPTCPRGTRDVGPDVAGWRQCAIVAER